MATLATVRVIIQDPPLYAKDTLMMDGTLKNTQVFYQPIVASSVIITGTAVLFTVDEDNGLIQFATPPLLGPITVEYKHVLLLDSNINALIALEEQQAGNNDGSTDDRLAAADCLDLIASSQALIQKKIKVLDLDTDGPALAKALRDHASTLRKQAYEQAMNESSFDIIEQINDKPGFREKIIKDWMRQAT
jgi:hypothetical protein